VLALAAVAPLYATDPNVERALNKLDQIESGRAKRGSVIVFTPAEMNAWARARVPAMYQGIRNPSVELGSGAASGFAFVDFLKLRQGVGRLIRTKSDRGIIVILDNRIVTRPYGRAFMQALPKCPVEII